MRQASMVEGVVQEVLVALLTAEQRRKAAVRDLSRSEGVGVGVVVCAEMMVRRRVKVRTLMGMEVNMVVGMLAFFCGNGSLEW